MYLQSDFEYSFRILVINKIIYYSHVVYERGLLDFVREFVIDWIIGMCAGI